MLWVKSPFANIQEPPFCFMCASTYINHHSRIHPCIHSHVPYLYVQTLV